MVGGDLNIFQSLMLQWEQLHPYNGVQLLAIPGSPPTSGQLTAAWHRAFVGMGLGGATHTDKEWSLDSTAIPNDPAFAQCASEQVAVESLSPWLNKQYMEGEIPVVPLVFSTPTGWLMGLAYRHYVADSVTVRRWIHGWWRELSGNPLVTETHRNVRAVGYYAAFHRAAGFSMLKGLLDTARVMGDMARAQRLTGPYECSAQHILHLGPVVETSDLLTVARAMNAKVSDLLLAAVGLSALRHGPMKRSSNRDHLALGSIIDLRPMTARELGDGLYLGYTSCLLGPTFMDSFASAVRCIARQSLVQRQTSQAGGSVFRLAAALAGNRFYKGKRLYEFYRKRMPLAAGLSNVNLAGSWVERECPSGSRYLRVSPVGPTMPIVLASTSCKGSLGVTFTYRNPLMSHAAAGEIMEDVRTILTAVCRTGRPRGPHLTTASLTERGGQSTLSA